MNTTIFLTVGITIVARTDFNFSTCKSPTGDAPNGAYAICMEVLRGLFILLGLSMFFSIVTSILTASEQLRETFPNENDVERNSASGVEDAEDENVTTAGTEEAGSEGVDHR